MNINAIYNAYLCNPNQKKEDRNKSTLNNTMSMR